MKKILLSALAFTLGAAAFAQSVDPVIMTIAGKPITRSEFEYSYNKNGNIEGAVEQKTVEEYVDMFINYKLKVAAAEAAQLDTMTSFRQEFEQYRNMQLLPHLVDTVYIDSVARSLYDRTKEQMKGEDLLRVAHILVVAKQDASEEEVKKANNKIDSLYLALQKGDDFAELAKQYSEDPGTSGKGGELPWIGPGMTLKEFETEAYKLQPGDISKPVKSSVGYHIIKMLERKQLEPYDTLKTNIIASLKRQGIEDLSAENRIGKIVAANKGRLDREAVLDSVMNAEIVKDPSLDYLIEEYHDGLLLYEISKREVWDPASEDVENLERVFKENKEKYVWTEPRFKGFVIHAKSEKALKKAKKILKKNADGQWRKIIKEELNKDSLLVRVSGPILVKQGENQYVDQYVFDGEPAKSKSIFPIAGVAGKKYKQPKIYADVKSQVEADYQEELEKAWIEKLRKQFPFSVDQSVLSTVNKH